MAAVEGARKAPVILRDQTGQTWVESPPGSDMFSQLVVTDAITYLAGHRVPASAFDQGPLSERAPFVDVLTETEFVARAEKILSNGDVIAITLPTYEAETLEILRSPRKPNETRVDLFRDLRERLFGPRAPRIVNYQPGLGVVIEEPIPEDEPQPDPVNHPSHYKAENGMESIDVIESFGLGFNLGNAVKYILRHGRKASETPTVDLEKAAWYIRREAKRLGGGEDL